MSFRLSDEMWWRPDSECDALTKRPKWQQFHRACGLRGFYFDRPVKQGRQYVCPAFKIGRTAQGGWTADKLCEGTGRTALDSMAAAYRATGRADAETDLLWDQVCGVPVESESAEVEFDDLF